MNSRLIGLALAAFSVATSVKANDEAVRAIFGGIIGGLLQAPQHQPEFGKPSADATIEQNVQGRQLELRAEIQHRLNLLGFEAGYPDGVFGTQTRLAIQAFQRDLHAPATGKITQDQVAVLYRRTNGAPPRLQDQDATIASAPQRLPRVTNIGQTNDKPPATEVVATNIDSQESTIMEVDATSKLTVDPADEQQDKSMATGQATTAQATITTSSQVAWKGGTLYPVEAENKAVVEVAAAASPLAAPPLGAIGTQTSATSVAYEIKPGPFSAKVTTADILGLRLGMNPEQVTNVMTAEGYQGRNPSMRSVISTQNPDGVQVVTNGPNDFVQSLSFAKSDSASSEVIEVTFVSPLNGNAVVKVFRQIQYLTKESKPARNDFANSAVVKYGPEFNQENHTKQVDLSGGGMNGYMSGVLGTTQYDNFNVLTLTWYYSQGNIIKDGKEYQDILTVEMTGKNPTIDKIAMLLETKETQVKDQGQMTLAAQDVSDMVKVLPKATGALPKL